MELLEGNTLKHLIAGKALAIEQVLELGIQISELSILGGAPRKLSPEGWAPAASPDGSQIVFLKSPAYGDSGLEIWLTGTNGGQQQKLVSASRSDVIGSPVWSPDGHSIAYVKQEFETYASSGTSAFFSVDWAADSKGLFVTSNPTGWRSSLLYVDQAGNAHELWQVKGSSQSWGIASRDGKYLASPAATTSSNVWMAEGY